MWKISQRNLLTKKKLSARFSGLYICSIFCLFVCLSVSVLHSQPTSYFFRICFLSPIYLLVIYHLRLSLIPSSSRLPFPMDPPVYMQRQKPPLPDFRPPKTGHKRCYNTFLIHFYLTYAFSTSKAELVIPTKICLGPYMDTHVHPYAYTYPWSTHNHTLARTYMYIHRAKPIYSITLIPHPFWSFIS